MRKFQFFLLVEALLLAMALMKILSEDVSAFVLILVVLLLVLRFYNIGNRHYFLLTSSSLLLFLIFMLNPFIIIAILLGIAYTVINHFAQVKKKNRYALLSFEEEHLGVAKTRHQWLGAVDYAPYQSHDFSDVNVIRISGSDTIDLSQVIMTGHTNVIMIRKIYGPTTIVVPIDVAVTLHVSAIYGSVRFLDAQEYDLRNESIQLKHAHFDKSRRSVKIVVNSIAGMVEVVDA